MAKKRLAEPYMGFYSIDERMKRVPDDLNDLDVREAYIKNHIDWFLKNNSVVKADFVKNVQDKYASKQMSLFQ